MVLFSLFSALSFLYYYKERQRYYQEKKIENRLEYSECKHLSKLLSSAPPCKMKVVVLNENDVNRIYEDILYAFLISLLLILSAAYFLAKLSLRPMRESVKSMDSFINGIVHDINTPLSVIRMNAQSISKNIKEDKLQRKVTRLLQGIEQVESLEEQLLFSLKVGQYQLKKERFDLGSVLQNREQYYNALRTSVTLHVNASSYEVFGDKSALLRMIDNIVLNAIKYSHPNSEVEISLKDDTLKVRDNGMGIKHPKKVFAKYYREASDTKGIGLGLFIVAKVAQLHEIDIKVESALNKGTSFNLSLNNISTLKLH